MKIVALAGGVGGAKLADGLNRIDPAQELTLVVNTGDDFSLFGLHISPDLDTVCYNLAEIENPNTGWGRREDSWETISEISHLGGPDWFRLGNKDLAVHLERSRRLRAGEVLSDITKSFCRTWGIRANVIPMSDDLVPTIVNTNEGDLPFQDYFVKLACRPGVIGFEYQDSTQAVPAPGVLGSIRAADLVIICPSNPWVSISPILAIPGIRKELLAKTVLAVSPIIGGAAVKGPAAKMYQEMGITPSAAAVAEHYQEILNGFVMDQTDEDQAANIRLADPGVELLLTDSWMNTRQDRVRLAREVIDFGRKIIKERL